MDFAKIRADYLRMIANSRDEARWAIQRMREGHAHAAEALAYARQNSHRLHGLMLALEVL